MDYIFLLGRILLGGYFIKSGYSHMKNLSHMAGYAASKGVPSPKLAVFGSGVLLWIGGLGIVLGGFVQLALVCLIVFLVPVTLMMHQYWKVTDPMQKMGEQINFNKNLALLGAVLMLLALSPSVWVLSLF